jgi:hypothetical protein
MFHFVLKLGDGKYISDLARKYGKKAILLLYPTSRVVIGL